MKNKNKVYKSERADILLAIIEWLYINHQAYDSGAEWKMAFIDFLKELLE